MGANSMSNVVSFRAKEYKIYTHVHFKCGIITPEVLKRMNPPRVNYKKGVVISGKGPIWLYGSLVHWYHPAAFVGVYEPRADGCVVVQSHTPGVEVGTVLAREDYEKEEDLVWRNPRGRR